MWLTKGALGERGDGQPAVLLFTLSWRAPFLDSSWLYQHPRLRCEADVSQTKRNKSPSSKYSESKGEVISTEVNPP